MTAHTDRRDELDPAMAMAVDWVVRLSSGDVTDEDADQFRKWFDDHPAHANAWRMLNSVRPAGRAIADKDYSSARMSRRAMLTAGGTAALAGLSFASLVRPPLGLWPSLAELMADHRTGTGQHYAFAPIDGVKVVLNARTSVGLLDSGKGLQLIDGEAWFTVTDTDAFFVQAASSRIETRQAQFDVETLSGKLELVCSSGAVRCTTGSKTEIIGPSERLSVTNSGDVMRSRADAAEIGSWRNGLLIFNGAPLSDVVARINRYRPGPIVLASQSMGRTPISAHFFTDQIEDSIPQLVRLLGVRARNLPGNVVLLG